VKKACTGDRGRFRLVGPAGPAGRRTRRGEPPRPASEKHDEQKTGFPAEPSGPSVADGYSLPQRWVALGYGAACHLLFVTAVVAMALALFNGMSIGRGPFRGGHAFLANVFLLASFPLTHSWLLSASGRRHLQRLAPLGIGKELSTTIFAMLSSANLAALFLLWSPSGVLWWKATGFLRKAIAVAAVGAWGLLVKSMHDSQLSLQTGFLGWSAVFRNRAPRYEPFSTRGVYRVVRQPIYVSFALILWMSAAWTPDQLAMATLWSAYCVLGAALKERRYLKYFGDAFRQYQARVPFWLPIPRRMRAVAEAPAAGGALDVDIVIAGAGPVGLLLANLLGRRGLRVLLADRLQKPRIESMAIGVTPPSMAILKDLGLDETFHRNGVAVDTARVFENRSYLGNVDFSRLPADHRFILSIPQSVTETLLRENLRQFPSVQRLAGVEFVGHRPEADRVVVRLRDVSTGARSEISAAYLVGCDGHRSAVRRQAGIQSSFMPYRLRFLMADFEDSSGLGNEAHLFFTRHGSVESFPLPGGRRRWIVLAGRDGTDDGNIASRVAARARRLTGHDVSRSRILFESEFQPSRALARRYVAGRVALCGDAAHVMSPIGGQGMNTGFADAEHLDRVLAGALRDPSVAPEAFARYERCRKRAFRVAARRAASGMWLGTRTGHVFSAIRRAFISRILFRPAVRERLAPYFAMLTLPGRFPEGAGPPAVADAAQ
jgi:2-polyprenyl-6-methoxyphenol hydroxylase-like FAD-dependent oxidoreductase/protein-S-isoprenylcysteine O-methyltransferase Ste14